MLPGLSECHVKLGRLICGSSSLRLRVCAPVLAGSKAAKTLRVVL